MARSLMADGEFIEVHVDTPLDVAEARDPKGLYKKARRGEITNFTGISSPYEAPDAPELCINTADMSPQAAADLVIAKLRALGMID
jgi:bifunctional enzyme CysN/CysC